MLSQHWRYLKRVLSHKWKVAKRCAARGLWWEAVTHDISKFRRDEWGPYSRRDFSKSDFDLEFAIALNNHYKRNPHHPQYWVQTPPRWAKGEEWQGCLPMPEWALKAMLCDWEAMSDDVRGYYLSNMDDIPLHPTSREWVEREIGIKRVSGVADNGLIEGILIETDPVTLAQKVRLANGKEFWFDAWEMNHP